MNEKRASNKILLLNKMRASKLFSNSKQDTSTGIGELRKLGQSPILAAPGSLINDSLAGSQETQVLAQLESANKILNSNKKGGQGAGKTAKINNRNNPSLYQSQFTTTNQDGGTVSNGGIMHHSQDNRQQSHGFNISPSLEDQHTETFHNRGGDITVRDGGQDMFQSPMLNLKGGQQVQTQWNNHRQNIQSFWSATGTTRAEKINQDNQGKMPSLEVGSRPYFIRGSAANPKRPEVMTTQFNNRRNLKKTENQQSITSEATGSVLQRNTTKVSQELAHQQNQVLNILFKKNQLFHERERQAQNMRLQVKSPNNQETSKEYQIEQKVTDGTSNGNLQKDSASGDILSPASWKRFEKPNNNNYTESAPGRYRNSIQGVPQSQTALVTSPFKSGTNFHQIPSMQRQFSPYSLQSNLEHSSDAYSMRKTQHGLTFLGSDTQLDVNTQQMQLMGLEFDQMVKSMKMLDLSSLNEHQIKTLKEIEQHLGKESGDQIASRERQFMNLLSEIKQKSDNLRRRKLHQVPSKMMKPQRGHPSFMSPKDSTSHIEQILKRKVDSNVVREFLGTTQTNIGEEQFSETMSQNNKFQCQFEPKEFKINLVEEYKNHLNAVSKMQNFASMKMYMDHTFFKVFMPEEIISNQGQAFDFTKQLEDDRKQTSLKSTILPSVHSFLEPQQESLIPTEPLTCLSTSAHFSLLLELKEFLRNQMTSRDILMGKEESLEVNIQNLRSFFHSVFQLTQEQMRIQSRDQKDLASTLITDYLFKIMMIKIDEIIANNKKMVQKEIDEQKLLARQWKKSMEEEIKRRDDQHTNVEKEQQRKYDELNEKFEKAHYDSMMFQELFQTARIELASITATDNRLENYESLKESFNQINKYIIEAEDQKIKQMRMLDTFSKLLDVTNKRKKENNFANQTELSLTNVYKDELGINQGFSLIDFNQSEFMQMASLVDIRNKDSFQLLLPEKIASMTEVILDQTGSHSKLQPALFKSMLSQGGNTKESLSQQIYNYLRSLKQHSVDGNVYAKTIIKLLQLDAKLPSQSIYGLFMKERNKYIEYLKVNQFKGMNWTDNFLFLQIPHSKMMQYARLNFKETRDLGEYFFEKMYFCLDFSQTEPVVDFSVFEFPQDTQDQILQEELPYLRKKYDQKFFIRCSHILSSLFNQMQFVNNTNNPQKLFIEALGQLGSTGRVTSQRMVDDLVTISRKQYLWLSRSDSECLVKLLDPRQTDTPNVQLLIRLLDKTKPLQDFSANTQIVIHGFLYATLHAFDLQLQQAKNNLAKHMEMFAASGNLDSSDCFKSYHCFEEALRHPNLGLPITEDEMIRAYCGYVVNSSMYSINDARGATQCAAKVVVQIIENGNNLVNLGSKKI